MSEDSFIFHHLKTDRDIEENLEIMRKVFGRNTGVDLLVKKLVYNHPTMTLKNHFVIKHRGKMVATLNLIPVDWSIGNIPLKAAEMGNVATLGEYRHRGLIRRLVNKYHKEVVNRGYDLSVIEGIPCFYRQFGYDYALPLDEETRMPLKKLPNHKSKLEIRPADCGDIPRAMKLLMQAQSKFYVHSVRNERIWRMQQETGLAAEYSFEGYAVEEDDEMIAYFRISRIPKDKKLILREVTDTNRPASNAILGFLKDIGRKHGLRMLIARTSYFDPLTRSLAAIGGEQTIPPYAWQIRITDYTSLLQKMKSLLENRLADSRFHSLTTKLSMNFCRFMIQMVIEKGEITSIQRLNIAERCAIGLNPPASTQLLLGYRSGRELQMIFPDFNVRPGYRRLVEVLFPKKPSFIHAVY